MEENVSPEQIKAIMAKAIQTAFIDHPIAPYGKTWDQQYKTDDESEHLAMAALVALDKAGLTIVEKEVQK